MKFKIVYLFIFVFALNVNAQILTKEDSLAAGLQVSSKTTVLSGYGECFASYNTGAKTGQVNFTRFVTFFGHRFTKTITLFSELEIENAKISNGSSGEFSLEQAFIKFDLNKKSYLVAGLYIPRIGIINENHLPTTYNGNQRHFVEKFIIPSTWRELGVGLYGQFDRLPGFNYYVGISNGLNSEDFTRTSGIRKGRYQGNTASINNLALHAAALYYYRKFRIQSSLYYGGTVGLAPLTADSLMLNGGPFGTPVALGETNVQYNAKQWGAKALVTAVDMPDAFAINRAYASNVPSQMRGAFVEFYKNILKPGDLFAKKCLLFARYEWVHMNAKMPSNGIKDLSLNQKFLTAGLTYKPTVGVAIKFDVVNRISGDLNPVFYQSQVTGTPRYLSNNWWVNLGLGYNF